MVFYQHSGELICRIKAVSPAPPSPPAASALIDCVCFIFLLVSCSLLELGIVNAIFILFFSLPPVSSLDQNLQMDYFIWSWYEFRLKSCFRENLQATVAKVLLGVALILLQLYHLPPLLLGHSSKETVLKNVDSLSE